MGGKHKQAQRTKNNARPSSSGRSAELLGTSINPFVGFSTVKDAPILPGFSFATSANDELDANLDTNFQLVLKKMNKKDATTKLKALQEFTELVKSSQPEAVKTVLAFWPRLYSVLAVDVEHRVREATHNAHHAVVLKVKRNLAPFLKQLAGPWFTSQYDTYAPAASAAVQSFEDAFPANKLQEAIVFCQEEILSYICENITVLTPQTLSNPKTTSPEESEAKYERLTVSSLQGYTLYLSKLSREQLQAAEEVNTKIISNAKFWKISKTKVPIIRAAWFGCITALCQNAPFLLKNEVQHVTGAVFNNLDETEPIVLHASWEAALYIVSNIEDWWKYVNIEKLVLPKLWKVLKEGGQGNAVAVFPNLLPLISHLPTSLDVHILYNNFFENIRIGMKKRTVLSSRSEFNTIAISFIECLRFTIMKNILDTQFCESLISTHLIPTIEWCFTEDSNLTKSLFTELSILLQYWGKNRDAPELKNYSLYIEHFWKLMEDTIANSLALAEQTFEKEQLVATCNKQIELLLCLKRLHHAKQKKCAKVKFVSPDRKPESGDCPSDIVGPTETKCLYTLELNTLVHKTCYLYLKSIKDNNRIDLLPLMCLIVQHFESVDLFVYLNCNLNSGSDKNLGDLHKNIFLKFLLVRSTCSEPVVDLVFTLYKYLIQDEKSMVLESLTKLSNEDCFCWCVAKALSHPYYNDLTIQNWLSTPQVTKLLIKIAESMLTDEISTDKSLLLKQAFIQNINGDLYISKEACKEIMLIFCRCLLSPSEYPYTIDVCASFAAQLAATLYTEQTLLTYGDQLILALFSMSCNTSCDPETISKDTLWEVMTSWQDIITLLTTESLTSEFENIIWKLTKIIQNEFLTNDSAELVDRLTNVSIELVKSVKQNDLCLVAIVLKSILGIPGVIRSVHEDFHSICICADILRGDLSWVSECPVKDAVFDLVCNDIQIVKYLSWHGFVVNVITALFKIEYDEDLYGEAILTMRTEEIYKFSMIALNSFGLAKSFINNYKTTKLHNKIQQISNKLQQNCCNIIELMNAEQLEKKLSLIDTFDYNTFNILYNDNTNLKITKMYTKLHLMKQDTRLTQLFAKYLSYDSVTEPKTMIEQLIVTRSLIHCPDNEVQIAEALTAIVGMREKNIPALLYNRDISGVKWEETQTVIEIIRLLKTIIVQKPHSFSAKHWDFVLISLTAWSDSVDKSKHKYKQLKVCEFVCAVCDLYSVFHKELCNGNLPCSNLLVEFSELFAQDVHMSLINTWIYVAEQELALQETSVCKIPALEVIGNLINSLDSTYLIKPGDPKLPKWQTLVQLCGKLLQSPVNVLQRWGYQGLNRILPKLVALDVAAVELNSPQAYGLMCSQLATVLTQMQDVVQMMLMDFKLGEDSCRVEPFTDSYTFTFGYLLLWDILLSFCQHASTDLRFQYSDWLKSGDYLQSLLSNLFKLMPTEVLHCTDGKKNSMTELFTVEPLFSLSAPSTSEHLEHTVCWVFARTVSNLPALIRQWWSDVEPRTAQIVEQVTAAYVSPKLCTQELLDVVEKEKTSKNNMKVKVHLSAREVIGTYTVDEARMELIITLPTNYPLGAVQVDCNKQIGGPAQWRHWVMQLTIFLTNQNGRIWDGLSLWKSNLDKKFDGVEECYICFSVLQYATYQLPKLSCQTCRKKFHSSCLYKWFSTSNKSTCPICRNLF